MTEEKEKHVRHQDDFYETPEWVVDVMMQYHPWLETTGAYERWLEPSFGQGAILGAVWRYAHHNWVLPAPKKWTAIDINQPTWEHRKGIEPICEDIIQGDFLKCEWNQGTEEDVYHLGKRFQVCIMNPPYSDVLAHVEHALKYANNVIALLRIGFMASQTRMKFHHRNQSNVLVLPKRPSFTNDGQTDKYDLAWFTFGHHAEGKWQVADLPESVLKPEKKRVSAK